MIRARWRQFPQQTQGSDFSPLQRVKPMQELDYPLQHSRWGAGLAPEVYTRAGFCLLVLILATTSK